MKMRRGKRFRPPQKKGQIGGKLAGRTNRYFERGDVGEGKLMEGQDR